jgi:acetoacetate decarboxylase
MARTRWVSDATWRPAAIPEGPPLDSLEAVYLTDPGLLASVLPPPLKPPQEPRVHVRITNIDIELPGEHRYLEKVGYFAVEALHEGTLGEYPLVIPIDLESAVAISRERFGEPKKLANIEISREGGHVQGGITRHGVTFLEMAGEVAEALALPSPYPAVQFWFKYLPAVEGPGFDAGPLLVRVDQVRTPLSLERVEGKLVLRDLDTAPVADLPVEELLSLSWTRRRSSVRPKVVGEVDPKTFAPFALARYDQV